MASDFLLIFLILVIYSLPTKQDDKPTAAADVPANKKLLKTESNDGNQVLQADEKIGETIEESEESQPLLASNSTNEVNDSKRLIVSSDESNALSKPVENKTSPTKTKLNQALTNCWLKLDAAKHFKVMDKLDDKYFSVRYSFNHRVVETLNRNMIQAFLENRGIAYRALHNTAGDPSQIPAGLNLGGFSMLRMRDSILFFHRMKLRNNTVFRVDFLENNLVDMTVTTRLCLNDLHLVGAYERSATHKNPSILFYAPSYGELEILLKNVNYNMEGRLRLQNRRLVIEVVDSKFIIKDDILMTYLDSKDSKPVRVQKEHLGEFLARMKNDLDWWLKDYFNDYYTYFQLDEEDEDFKTYEKKRLISYNDYATHIITSLKQRIYDMGFYQVKIPNFTLFSVPNVQVKLSDGVICGLESIFKRSKVTGKKVKNIRYINMLVGFSNLKVEYKFSVMLPNNQPPIPGRLILTADDLTAHLQISMVKDPEAIDLRFDFVKQFKPESLVVEGPANKFIANFRHLLENHAIAIMSNVLIHNINMLGTITRCNPNLYTDNEPNAYSFGRPSDAPRKLCFDFLWWLLGYDNGANTQPPPTQPPTTRPPLTNPPTTRPPPTKPRTTRPPPTKPRTTRPPPTKPRTTRPPTTNPPSTSTFRAPYMYISTEQNRDV